MSELNLKLYYFPLRARAEGIRLALRYSNIPFEDIVIGKEEFMKMKADLPGGQLPILEVNGTQYPESGSILRFVGHLAGHTPKDSVQFLKAEAAFEFVGSIAALNPVVNIYTGEKLHEAYLKCFEQLPRKMKYLTETLSDMKFFGGEEPCYADFGIWHYLDQTETVKPGTVTAENLNAWIKRVAELPNIAQYLSERRTVPEERMKLIRGLRDLEE